MSEAVDLITRLCSMLKEGLVELGKFVSSSPEVLSSLDLCLVSDKVRKINIEDKVQERALGVVWNLQTDSFTYNVSNFSDSSFSRRKVLSIVSSVFDPLGLVSPFILLGKRILQDLCILGCSWDDALPPDLDSRFRKWLSCVKDLEQVSILRCLRPSDFDVSVCELHHFWDGSLLGYEACSYIRLLSDSCLPSAFLIFVKFRVATV